MNSNELKYKEEHEKEEYLNSVVTRYTDPLAKIFFNGLWKAVLQHLKPSGTMLDLGCGAGYFLQAVSSKGYDAYGMDISTGCLSIAKNLCGKNIVVAGNLERLPFHTNSIDTVMVMGALHHLKNPSGSIKEIARILKPEGTFIAEEPNRNIFTIVMRGSLRRLVTSYRKKPYQTDFTLEELKTLLIGEGFTVEKSERYGLLTYLWSLPDTFPAVKFFGANRLSISLVKFLSCFDSFFCKIPLLNRLCWQNIVKCKNIK